MLKPHKQSQSKLHIKHLCDVVIRICGCGLLLKWGVVREWEDFDFIGTQWVQNN